MLAALCFRGCGGGVSVHGWAVVSCADQGRSDVVPADMDLRCL